ncbi:unnamed protein product [Medioppia subpectinata]|uniref:Uncharacterized protein n=1 Tax=Medioppia subpectinata TaxID=1979941 RepID=A0A7R9KQY1_9ACAR|nr:unnamed protein product [Medioppia subpectinata]CAG2106794.1 unnamed protein product [Medioppia subpectinata]
MSASDTYVLVEARLLTSSGLALTPIDRYDVSMSASDTYVLVEAGLRTSSGLALTPIDDCFGSGGRVLSGEWPTVAAVDVRLQRALDMNYDTNRSAMASIVVLIQSLKASVDNEETIESDEQFSSARETKSLLRQRVGDMFEVNTGTVTAGRCAGDVFFSANAYVADDQYGCAGDKGAATLTMRYIDARLTGPKCGGHCSLETAYKGETGITYRSCTPNSDTYRIVSYGVAHLSDDLRAPPATQHNTIQYKLISKLFIVNH